MVIMPHFWSHQTQLAPYMSYQQPSPFNIAPSSASLNVAPISISFNPAPSTVTYSRSRLHLRWYVFIVELIHAYGVVVLTHFLMCCVTFVQLILGMKRWLLWMPNICRPGRQWLQCCQNCRCLSGSTLNTAFVSVHELSVHIHGRFLGTVQVRVRFVPENSCCTVVHG